MKSPLNRPLKSPLKSPLLIDEGDLSALMYPQFVNGKLNTNGWENNSTSPCNVLDHEGLWFKVPAGELVYKSARNELNLAANTNIPETQNITVVSGNEYALRIEGESGSTAVFSGAASATLTNTGLTPISTNNGVPVTAGTTTLAVAITGNVTRLGVYDVTGRSNQNPPEYISAGAGDGAEVLENGDFSSGFDGWNSHVGWGIVSGGAKHTPGSTNSLVQNKLSLNETYLMRCIISGRTAGSVRQRAGNGTSGANISTNGEIIELLTCSGNTEYLLTPTSAFDGTITLASVQKATKGFATFNRENGNTVDINGIVTEAEGAKLSPIWIRYPAATCLVNQSTNPTVWPEVFATAVPTTDRIAGLLACEISGQTEVWHRLTAVYIYGQVGAYTMSVYCAAGNQSHIRITIRNTTSAQEADAEFNIGDLTVTPDINVLAGVTTFLGVQAAKAGFIYSFSFLPATDGDDVQWAVGTGTDNPADSILVAAAQIEQGAFVTPLIETSGSPATRNATAYRQALDLGGNFNQAEGTLIFKWVPEYDINNVNVDSGIFSIRDHLESVLFHGSTGAKTTDGTNTTTEIAINSNSTDMYGAVVRWSTTDNILQVAVKNTTTGGSVTWSATVPYDGAFTAGDWINLFYDNGFTNQIHGIEVFKRCLSTSESESKL